MPRLMLVAIVLLTTGVAVADAVEGATLRVPTAGETAASSFEAFAAEWMLKVRAEEQHHRAHPTVQQGAREPVVTFRGYGDRYSTETRATGRASAPFVGLLRYTEHVYTCRTVEARVCSIASTVPVTEIFRFRNGRWGY